VQFIKTICVLVVLGALAYGAYTTLTGKPKTDPPGETANWDSPPRIELPGGNDVATGNGAIAPAGPAGGSAPKYGDTPGAARIVPGAGLAPPPFSTGAPTTSTSAAPATSTVPSSYPKTNSIPGPFDGHGAVHLVSNTGPSSTATTTPSTTATTASQGPALTAATSPAPPINAADALAKGQAFLAQRDYLHALNEFSQCFDSPSLPPADVSKVQELLDQLAGTVIYSREHLMEPAHVVAQGETLQAIAQQHNVSVGLLAKINGVADPLYLPAGTQLKMVKGPFDAVVDKSHGKLIVFVDEMYAGSFPLTPGFEFPEGNYTVEQLNKGTLNASAGAGAAAVPVRGIMLSGGLTIIGGGDESVAPNGDPRSGVRALSFRDADDVCDILTVGSKVVVRK
jgi:LysM repeat protein